MKKQMMMLLSALLIVFSVFPALQSQAAEVTKQEAEVTFDVLKADKDEKSTAGDFMKSPAKVVVEGDKTYAYVTLLQTKYWQSLKVQTTQPGAFTDTNFVTAEVVSEDATADTKVVKFEIQDATKVLNVKAHIIVTGVPGIGKYDHTYDLRLKFEGSKVPTTPEVKPEEKPEVKPEALKDGAYTVAFKALHEKEDKASSMARYIDTPAALTVKDGKNLVSLTLTNNEQITAFQVAEGDKFVDATVVSTDEKANTRVVVFEVADLSVIMNTKVTVSVPAQNYTGNHVVRLAFDKASIKAADATTETPEAPFTDIEKSFAKQYIAALATKDIVKGKTATTFAPNEQITRAQFVVILSRVLDLPKKEFEGLFSDVSSNMKSAVYEIEAANRAGIVNGAGKGKFLPNEVITRQQMATMIIQAIEFKDESLLEGVTTKVAFTDTKNLKADAQKVIDLAAGLGIINGREVNGQKVFEPTKNATRAEAATMVYQLVEKLK
ncbi:NEAT domain-containing protein [Sporosarcina sp. NPDC096371]|uniref:NEAT domain-containing protein n=1 Tax=Sporosarcina sp. NPDC096371 TaxID=3364530 RepID=UPI0038035E35